MFIELDVRTAIIVHGYDSKNSIIEEEIDEMKYMKKIVAVNRIQSISENYILVSSSHGRIMYWEYKGTMTDIKAKMAKSNISIA